MPEVLPFRGVRFEPARAGALDDIVTPPYDVITPDQRRELAARNPHNMVHLILPEERDGQTRYETAARDWENWRASGVLSTDDAPSYYLLRQDFTDRDGRVRTRTGFFAAVKIPEAGEQSILGHERTFPKPVQDRLYLTEATRANLGPVFCLYDDPEGALGGFYAQANARPPDGAADTIDGARSEWWRVPAEPAVEEFFRGRRLYIADGHHRFQTAVTYRDAQRALHGNGNSFQRYDYVLIGLVEFGDPGLTIYAPHRVVAKPPELDASQFLTRLREWFDVAAVSSDLLQAVSNADAGNVIGLSMRDGDFLLRLHDNQRDALLGTTEPAPWRALDVAVLHAGILERLLKLPAGAQHEYEKDPAAAVARAHAQDALAFILRPIAPRQVRDVADAGAFMPQKATYFFPKLPSGAVMHALYD